MPRASSSSHRTDTAVSPVIAVILMVAITVVLAASVYVWISGFTETRDRAPDANLRLVECEPASNLTRWRLVSGGPVDLSRTDLLVSVEDGPEEGEVRPIGDDTLEAGASFVLSDTSSPTWDTTPDLRDGTRYTGSFVDDPSATTFASVPFTC